MIGKLSQSPVIEAAHRINIGGAGLAVLIGKLIGGSHGILLCIGKVHLCRIFPFRHLSPVHIVELRILILIPLQRNFYRRFGYTLQILNLAGRVFRDGHYHLLFQVI